MRISLSIPPDGSILHVSGLELTDGGTTVVFGNNGAGKSTLLRALAGLSGSPLVPGPVYMQQRPYLFRGTARHNLGLGLDPEQAAWGRQLADHFGVGHLLEQDSGTLSGGERQRLVLARTLAFSGDWVLLDEPLSAIDRSDRTSLLAVLAELLDRRSAVVVTHDIDVVATLADRLVVIDGGRILQQGPVAEVIGSPEGIRTAEVLGVANLVGGVARPQDGGCVLDSGSVEIRGLGDVSGPARALFGAEAVTLRSVGSRPTSARNSWSGVVETILRRGQLVEVAVDVGVRVVALVTPGALVDLDLKPGHEIGVSVKASAVRIVPA
ncbi:MAG: ATP-binding cassette domain-containing protein [Acidimicrobiia bacterium]|nr:ATP-binding cassette domain-containing protein [Acidimicrobiia bacterium]